ncbi:hypothetical protein ACH5RR_023452 [Cinchona calisaya]|uniref:Uncharacterized protein n=1 Tax=Cinchona calisaya TaxID=153742 RepID=A0ABD2ZE11_9GENT
MMGVNIVNIKLFSSNKIGATQKQAKDPSILVPSSRGVQLLYGDRLVETESITLVIDDKPQTWIRRKQAPEAHCYGGDDIVWRSIDSIESSTLKKATQQLMRQLKVGVIDWSNVTQGTEIVIGNLISMTQDMEEDPS